MAKSPSMKQRKLIKMMVEHPEMSKKDMILASGYSKTTAEGAPNKVLNTPVVRTALQEALISAGVDDKSISRVVKGAMGAKRGKQPDHYARLKSAELAMKVRGDLIERTEVVKTPPVQIIITRKEDGQASGRA